MCDFFYSWAGSIFRCVAIKDISVEEPGLKKENKQTQPKAKQRKRFFSEYGKLNVKTPCLSLSKIFCKIGSKVYFGKQTSCAAVGTRLCMRFFLKPLISRWGKASVVRDRRGEVNDAWLITENRDCGWYATPEGVTDPEKADAPGGWGYPAPFAAKLFTAFAPVVLIAKWQGVIS